VIMSPSYCMISLNCSPTKGFNLDYRTCKVFAKFRIGCITIIKVSDNFEEN